MGSTVVQIGRRTLTAPFNSLGRYHKEKLRMFHASFYQKQVAYMIHLYFRSTLVGTEATVIHV